MRKFYISLSFYLFIFINLTSATTFAYTYYSGASDRITLTQDYFGDHNVWISGCSFNQGSQGEMNAFLAMANWNNPKSAESVFRSEWVSCALSEHRGRWSQENDLGEWAPNSQIVVTPTLKRKLAGLHQRTTNFASNKAVAFTLFIKAGFQTGEQVCIDNGNAANLKMLLTHELGHGLGIWHTQATRWASMRPGAPNGYYCDIQTGQAMADIYPDDVAALQSSYPDYDLVYTPWTPTNYTQILKPSFDLAASAYENSGAGTGRKDISRADPPDDPNNLYCPGDEIPNVEYTVANLGNRTIKYTRTFWSSRTTDLSTGDKSVLWQHSNRIKSPGDRVGIFQGKKHLYLGESDLPPVGEQWFMVMRLDDIEDENGNVINEDRTENNGMVHSIKIRRSPSCP